MGKSHSWERNAFSEWFDRNFKYIILFPMIILLVAISLYPIITLCYMSLNNITFQRGAFVFQWVGLQNFINAFKDSTFRLSFVNTLIYVVTAVGLETFFGFTLALLAHDLKRGKVFFQTVFILPFLIPPVVNGIMWRLMFNNQYGLINLIFKTIGLSPQRWLSQPKTALAAVIFVTVWQWVGYNFLLMLAGLKTVPQSVIEAAKIDGATDFRLSINVLIPIMRPTIIVTLLFRIIHAFKGFDLVFVLTGGGPGKATEIINTYIQKVFVTQQRLGYGSVLSIISIFIIGLIAIGMERFKGREERW